MKKVLLLVLITMMTIALPLTAKNNNMAKKGKKFEVNLKNKGMFVMLGSDNKVRAGVVIALATKTLIRGGGATIVLTGKALKLALKSSKSEKFGPKGLTVKQMLKKFIKKGGKLIICAMCAKSKGLTNKDFIAGTKIKMADRVLEQMFQKDWKVLSY